MPPSSTLTPSPTPATPAFERSAGAVVESMERRTLLSATFEELGTLAEADFDFDGTSESVVFANRRQLRLAGLALTGRHFRRGALLILDARDHLFVDPMPLPFRGGAPEIVVGDFTSDGRLDLILGGGRRGNLVLLPGTGDGTFGGAIPVPGPRGDVLSVEAADLNADGITDLIVTTRPRRFSFTDRGLFDRFDRELYGYDRIVPVENLGIVGTLGIDEVPAVGSPNFFVGVTPAAGAGLVGTAADPIAEPVFFVGSTPEAGGGVVGFGGSNETLFFDRESIPRRPAVEVTILLGNGNGTFDAANPLSPIDFDD